MYSPSMPFRCGVCQKELRLIWAVLRATPFPICSRCRLMVHHGCLSQTQPPVCRRCAAGQSAETASPQAAEGPERAGDRGRGGNPGEETGGSA